MESDALAQLAMEAVIDGLRLIPMQRQKDMQDFSKRFTGEGFKGYTQWMQNINSSQKIVSIGGVPSAYLKRENAVNGLSHWDILVKILLRYRDENYKRQTMSAHALSLTVVRKADTSNGISIAQWREADSTEVQLGWTEIVLDCSKMLQRRLEPTSWWQAPLNQPNMDEKQLLTWAQLAVCESLETYGEKEGAV